ncbi:alpha/beta fold hydrolase [Lacticaseibacillus brantae]|uniref:Haloacid dehalogenase n=1 Tax=Lacticaseibacillus brantae DSM 23927 TaxID=1423727 RepID=A0A0R2B0C2_9LACO|nr:alpha/beta hydrolase [Lacticaseibacillus brantae]KRM72973.1 haloacid dehalogenase [Lacticaseibacillus brantae DSM 23927]
MSYLNLEGAKLHYDTVGSGPLLILIPGANGTGDIFAHAAEFLKDKFMVVMFDRRGYGQSELTGATPEDIIDIDSTYRIKTDAKDVHALAQALSPNQKAYIMGSSSGSIVAMETLQDFPEIVEKIAFHEPPINSFLPTAAQDQATNNDIVQTALTGDMQAAMVKFGQAMRIGGLDAQMMGKPVVGADAVTADARVKGMQYWFKYEIRQYTSRKIDIDLLKQYRDKISLLDGTDSRGSYPQMVNDFLAQYWDVTIYDIPGGHLGYAQKPEGFGTTLAAVLL